ncbi:MAG: Flp family type IVb pilin [Pseudolabrys sp.]
MQSSKLMRQIRRFLSAKDGATAIEYALIAAGIAGAIIAVITTLGGSVNTMWTSVKNALG